MAVTKAFKKSNGIQLDIGCGDNKQPGYVGMDYRKTKNVDIQHSIEDCPLPFPDNYCRTILMSHLIEHLKPWLIIDIFNELWRISKVGGQLLIAMPYAGSFGFWQDPTHTKPWNEATPTYFDPSKFLYNIYKPKPWKIVRNAWFQTGNMEIIMEKLPLKHGIVTPGGYENIENDNKPKPTRKRKAKK